LKLSFTESGSLLKVHVLGQFMELFDEILLPLVKDRKKLNRTLVSFEVSGCSIQARPTLSYDFTVIEDDGLQPHINTKQGPKQYYSTSEMSIRIGDFDVRIQ